MKHDFGLCNSHPDFHTPEDVDVGQNLDGDELGRKLKESHVHTFYMYAKCHYGHAYYPTEVGYTHPRLRRDMLGEVVRGCHKHGIRVIAYYSMLVDKHAGIEHPDWCNITWQGTTHTAVYRQVCLNAPYIDELLIPQSREILKKYDVDGIFFDTMSRFSPCYCPHCRKAFGKDIPLCGKEGEMPEIEGTAWREYIQWHREQYENCFKKITDAMREARSDATVAFNWMCSALHPVKPVADVDYLLGDGPSSTLACNFHCRYWAGTGYPFGYFVGRFSHGLGDWDSAPHVMLKQIAAACTANGGGFYIIDRMRPDGTLAPPAYDAMRETFGFIHEREAALIGTKHVPEIAVLLSESSLSGPGAVFFAKPLIRDKREQPVVGAVNLLTQYARHFTTVGEDTLVEHMDDYRLIVLAEQDILPDAAKDRLADYVKNGGRLLITQNTATLASSGDKDGQVGGFAFQSTHAGESSAGESADPDICGLAGVEFKGFTHLQYGFIGDGAPITVRGRFAKVTPISAVTLFRTVEPMGGDEMDRQFGWGYAPPGQVSEWPAAVSHAMGKGQVIYVAGPVFTSYATHQSRQLARFLLALVDRLLPDPLVRVEAPPYVQMSAMRRGNDLVVHLVNLSGERHVGMVRAQKYTPMTETVPDLRDIRVRVRDNGKITAVHSVPGDRQLKHETQNGYAGVAIPSLHIMESIEIKAYFRN